MKIIKCALLVACLFALKYTGDIATNDCLLLGNTQNDCEILNN